MGGKRKLSIDKQLELIEEYKTGTISIHKIGPKYNISYNAARDLILSHGILPNKEINRKYSFNEHFFDVIDTEIKAYMLGFFYADGCNHSNKNTVTIALSECDKEILERFNIELENNRPLQFCKKHVETRQNQFMIILSSRHLTEQMTRIGCAPRKSSILQFPSDDIVPRDLKRHFIRGYFDGDGYFSVIECGPTKYLNIRAGFTSSLFFLGGLVSFLGEDISEDYSNITIVSRKQDAKWGTVCTYSKNCARLMTWMYGGSTIFLKRKYDKWMNFKQIYIPKRSDFFDWSLDGVYF